MCSRLGRQGRGRAPISRVLHPLRVQLNKVRLLGRVGRPLMLVLRNERLQEPVLHHGRVLLLSLGAGEQDSAVLLAPAMAGRVPVEPISGLVL